MFLVIAFSFFFLLELFFRASLIWVRSGSPSTFYSKALVDPSEVSPIVWGVIFCKCLLLDQIKCYQHFRELPVRHPIKYRTSNTEPIRCKVKKTPSSVQWVWRRGRLVLSCRARGITFQEACMRSSPLSRHPWHSIPAQLRHLPCSSLLTGLGKQWDVIQGSGPWHPHGTLGSWHQPGPASSLQAFREWIGRWEILYLSIYVLHLSDK